MRYRIWMDHDESDSHSWGSTFIHPTLDGAQQELEILCDSNIDGTISYDIIDLTTGYPYYITTEQAVKIGLPKRV